MKTKNIITIAALVLALCACNTIEDIPQVDANGEITITAKLSPKSPLTKAVSDQGTTIQVDWAQNEHLAILYAIGSTKYASDATIVSVDGTTGEATVTFTVNGSTPDNTACTIVYPLSAAKADHSGVKTYAEMLSAQDGTLNANLDVRVGAGKIRTANPDLDVTTQPVAQFAIFKFTLGFQPLTFTVKRAGSVVTTVTPSAATAATQNLYVAVPPAAAGTAYEFIAYDVTNKYTKSITAKKAIESGYFYQTTLSWTTTALTAVNLSGVTENVSVSDGSRLSGTITNPVKVSVAPGATVVLDNITISKFDVNCSYAGLTCEGNATIILNGTNTLTGFYEDYPGISVEPYNTLTIKGSGTLEASCGKGSMGAAPGIGGFMGTGSGKIIIEGGNITATGGQGCAGIGGGVTGSCDGIEIHGGNITATGGKMAPGIGGGRGQRCEYITITSGVTRVQASVSGSEPGPCSIGKGADYLDTSSQWHYASCGTVTIGGVVYWDGSAYQNGGDTYLTTSPLVYVP